MSIIRYIIISFFAFLFLQSCKKESSQNAATGGHRLQEIIKTWSDDTIGYTFFQYDSQNRLVEIRDSTNNYDNYINNPFPNSFIEYNSQSKPIKFITGGETDSLIYNNNNNQVVKKLYLNSNGYVDTYAYDAEGRLIGDTIGNGSEVYGYWTFTYDTNGDIVQWKEYSGTSDTVELISTSYNSSNNPINGNSLGITYYFLQNNSINNDFGLTDNNFALSKHYPFQINYDFIGYQGYNMDYNYQYVYYPNGLPETVVLFDNTVASSPMEIESTKYLYE